MQRLEPIASKYAIPKSTDRDSEFEVQAFLYNELKDAGKDVRGEVAWFDPQLRIHCRFDLVIYEGDAAKEILEVKPKQIKHKTCLEDTRQGRRYRLFGVPVTFVYGMSDAREYLGAL